MCDTDEVARETCRESGQKVEQLPIDKTRPDEETARLEFGEEALPREGTRARRRPSLDRQAQRPPEQRAGELLEEEAPARLEDAADLGQSGRPLRHLVDRAKVEDRIERPIGCVDLGRISKQHASPWTLREPAPGALDHVGVDIDRDKLGGTEAVEDDLGADAAPAPELENAAAHDAPPDPLEQRGDRTSLHERPRRAVQAELAEAGQPRHCRLIVPTNRGQRQPKLCRSQYDAGRLRGWRTCGRALRRPGQWASLPGRVAFAVGRTPGACA